MDKETFEALELLMKRAERHLIHATYQEDTREAWKRLADWMEEYRNEIEE